MIKEIEKVFPKYANSDHSHNTVTIQIYLRNDEDKRFPHLITHWVILNTTRETINHDGDVHSK